MRKNLIQGIGITIVCFLLFLLPVQAAEPSVSLKEDGNKVTATLELSDSMKSTEIVSLQLSFIVKAKPVLKKDQVNFEFKVPSTICEFRYHEEDGRLNIYISGTENLFKEGNLFEGNKLSLGNIVLTGSVKNTVIRVEKDSLVMVNSAFDMGEKMDVQGVSLTELENSTDSDTSGDNSDPWESVDSGSYPKGPGGSHLVPVDRDPKPVINLNVNTNSKPQTEESVNKPNSTQPTTTAKTEEKNQTAANDESSTTQSADEKDSQQAAANPNSSSNTQPAGNRTNVPSQNNNNNSNSVSRDNTGKNNTGEEISSSGTGGEEESTTSTETESNSTESVQEVATVSNSNEKETSSDRNTLLMAALGSVLVAASGGAVFVFKLTEIPKKKNRR